MAVCSTCGDDMLLVDSCSERTALRFGGELLATSGTARPIDGSERCHDCNVAIGGIHHPNCLVECCHQCGGQFVQCYHDQPVLRQLWWHALDLIRWPA